MAEFVHERHKAPHPLEMSRDLVLACPQLRSNVNLSRIVRVAGCCGVTRMIVCGNAKVDAKIARNATEQVELTFRRSLGPALKSLKTDGYRLIGLEQTSNSTSLHEFVFPRRAVLVIGHERLGLTEEILAMLDDVVEIPVYGLPHSYNVATATTMALYEYCRQYPDG